MIVLRDASRFPGEKEFAFRHAPLRDAAYEMLTDDDRALGHRLAAEWLERVGEQSATVLADHFERGRDSARAVRWYRRAAEQALEGNDYRTAVTAATSGIRAGATGDTLAHLHLLAGEAHRWLGDLEKTEQHAAEVFAVVPHGSDRWFEAARLTVVSAGPSGHLAVAYDIGEQLLAVPIDGEVKQVQAVTMLIASAQMRRTVRRELGDAIRARIDSIVGDLAERDPIVMARLERTRALERGAEGDVYACLQHQIRCVEAFERAGDLRSAALIRPDVGFAFSELGLYEDAERTLRRALDDAQRIGLPSAVAGAQHNLGMVLARLGQVEAGERLQWDALRIFNASGNKRLEGGTRAYLAEILLLGGKVQGAEREARNAVESLEAHPPLRAYALAVLSRVLLARGAKSEALDAAREAMRLIEGGLETNDLLLRVRYADVLLANGARDEARRIIADAKETLEMRAGHIDDPAVRVRFLTAVPEHARVLELASELA
jgi:tetratricopeptide (TPR) repeat protein